MFYLIATATRNLIGEGRPVNTWEPTDLQEVLETALAPPTDEHPTAYRWTGSGWELIPGFDPNVGLKDAIQNDRWANDAALKAFAEIVKDELNTLRAEHGLADRTMAQLKAAMESKL